MLEPTLYFSGTILGTLVVSILICRHRAARQMQIGFGTVFTSALIANVVVMLAFGFYEVGWDIFTADAWTGGKGGLDAALFVLGVITTICILPALGVAVYYERRSKKNERPVA